MDPIEISDKAAVRLDEYKGSYTLISCWKGREGWKDNWCEVSFGKEIKRRPLGAYLGDKKAALAALEALWRELGGEEKVEEIPEDSIPF